MKISIIVPVYNSEDRLDKCIQSILNQTLQDFELILINDGSKDNSLSICESYAKMDSRFVVINQENAGPSAARNRGIDIAKGKYIVFIDSDDYVAPQYLESFFNLDNNPEKTLVQQGYIRKYMNGKEKTFSFPSKIYNQSDFSGLFLSTELIRKLPFPWAKLYCTKIIKQCNIRFEIDIKYGEDLIFLIEYLKYIETFILIDSSCYYYEYNEESLTYNLYSSESEFRRFNLVRSKLESLNKRFELSEKTISYNNSYTINFLLRGFKALYLYDNNKQRDIRVNTIKNYANNDVKEVVKYDYRPLRRLDLIFKLLFNNKLYNTLDWYFTIRFRILKF